MKVGEVYSMLGMDFAQFNKDERTAKRRTETLGSSLSGVLKNAFSFTLGMGFFSAVQTGFRSTVGTMISFNAQMEQAQIGFTTMLGSAQRAKRFLDDVAKFAAKTPFEFPDLLDASKRMLAYGFAAEDVLPTMEAVGNATAAVGLGAQGINRIILALGQMRAKGKVSSEEMRQLTETGIPAWEILAEAMGKSTAEVMDLSQRGLIPAEQAIKMFTEGMNKRFPGMMSKMENTWEGVTSTIKDVWQMTIGEVTKGLFQGAVSWLQKVRDVATGFYDAFRAGGLQYAIEQTFGAGVAASVSTLTSALKGLWGIVVGVGRTIVRYWSTIGPLTAWVVKGFLAFKTAGFVVRMAAAAVKTFTAASLAMRGSLVATSPSFLKLISDIVLYYKCLIPATVGTFGFSTALTYLKAALMAVQTALGAVIWPILIIGALLMGGTALWSKYTQAVQSAAQKAQMERMAQQQQEYADDVTEAAKGTEAQADALKDMGKAASKNLQSFDEVHTLMEDVADATLGGPALDAGVTAPAIPEMELPDFSFDMEAAIAGAKADMGGFWGWLKQSASEAWGSVKTWGSNLWEGVKGGWAGFKTYASGFWENLKTAGGQAWNTIKTDASNLWEGAKGAWGTFKDWAGGLWDSMKVKAAETWEGIRTGAANGWENIKTTVATKWENFKAGASQTWEQVKAGASNAWQSIKTGAATGWENIKTTIATKWDEIRTGASNTWANIKTSASTAWQDLKANTSTAWGNIKNTISQHWNELRAEAPQTWETIKTSIESRWEALKASAPQKWEDIKTAITTRFESAKTTVLAAAQDLYDKVPKTWDEMRAAIADLKDKVVNAITGPFEAAKQTVLGIVDAAKNWGRNLIDNIVAGIKSTASRVKDAVSGVVGTIKVWFGSWAGPLWDGVKEKWSSFKEWAGGLWDGVKEKWGGFKTWAGETWDGIKTTLGEKWQGIKTKAAETWEQVKTGAFNAWQNIKTGATTAWENIKTTVATKWEAFKTGAANTWEQVKTGASNAWQSIKTGAATGWDGIKTAISTKWDSLKTGASATWNNVKSTISQKWNELKTEAPATWENIKTSISTRWNDLKSQAPTVWENVKNSIATRWNALKAEAPTTWESIKTDIATRWDSLKNSAPGTWDNIKTAISSRFDEAKANVLTAAQTMYDKVPKTWDEMRAAIASLKDKVVSAITGPFEAAKQTVLGIIDSAKNWGRNLIDNIVDGIKAKAASVKSAVQNVASTIKGWLGFSSPTEEGPGRYADQWAPNLMRMYAKGILDNISMVQSAASQVTRSLMPMTTMPAPAFAGMGDVGRLGMGRGGGLADELAAAIRGVGGIGGNRPIEVTINIDGRRMARALIPALQSEQDRVETNTIIRTK